jgi:hypothetical protein
VIYVESALDFSTTRICVGTVAAYIATGILCTLSPRPFIALTANEYYLPAITFDE